MDQRSAPMERCEFRDPISNIARKLFLALLLTGTAPLVAEPGFLGVVVSAGVTEVAPRQAGRVAAVTVRAGDTLRRGQLVARVEVPESAAELAGARAALAIAQSGVAQAETALGLASERVRRVQAAAEVFSEFDRSAAVAAEETAASGLTAARARVAQAEAEIDRLTARAAGAELRSPVDGWVAARLLDPGAPVAAGQAVLRVKSGERYLLRFAVPPAEAARLAPGQPLRVRPEGAEASSPARLARLAREVDLPSQMIFCEADLDPAALPAGLLQDGLVVRVVVE